MGGSHAGVRGLFFMLAHPGWLAQAHWCGLYIIILVRTTEEDVRTWEGCSEGCVQGRHKMIEELCKCARASLRLSISDSQSFPSFTWNACGDLARTAGLANAACLASTQRTDLAREVWRGPGQAASEWCMTL